MQTLQAGLLPGDRIVHDNKLSFFPSLVYAPLLPQSFLADVPGSPNDTLAFASQQALALFPQPDMQSAVGDATRVYFVVFTATLQEYQQAGLPDHPQLTYLKSHFNLANTAQYNDLLVYEFQR
jgi:mannosyltransferase